MMFICFAHCETGFRNFSPLEGTVISYDPKYLQWLIAQEATKTDMLKNHAQMTEQQVRELRDQMNLPPMVDHALEQQRKAVIDQIRYQRRLATAEAAVNGNLVRNVMYTEDMKQAIAYTAGVMDESQRIQGSGSEAHQGGSEQAGVEP